MGLGFRVWGLGFRDSGYLIGVLVKRGSHSLGVYVGSQAFLRSSLGVFHLPLTVLNRDYKP